VRILLHHLTPLALTPGGPQLQIIHTCEALKRLGLDAELFRWYDGKQKGDILHFFGRIPPQLLELAHDNGLKVVLTDWRPAGKFALPRWARSLLKRMTPRQIAPYFGWDIYRSADACVAQTSADAAWMIESCGAPHEKTHVVPFDQSAKELAEVYRSLVGTISTSSQK